MSIAWITRDRTFRVRRDQIVKTAWIDPHKCRLGSRAPMVVEAVAEKCRELLQQPEGAAIWPPVNGHWDGDVFVVDDGRHELLAHLIRGDQEMLVCWLEPRVATVTGKPLTSGIKEVTHG